MGTPRLPSRVTVPLALGTQTLPSPSMATPAVCCRSPRPPPVKAERRLLELSYSITEEEPATQMSPETSKARPEAPPVKFNAGRASDAWEEPLDRCAATLASALRATLVWGAISWTVKFFDCVLFAGSGSGV